MVIHVRVTCMRMSSLVTHALLVTRDDSEHRPGLPNHFRICGPDRTASKSVVASYCCSFSGGVIWDVLLGKAGSAELRAS